jgi:hypothetical protein
MLRLEKPLMRLTGKAAGGDRGFINANLAMIFKEMPC